MKIPKKIKEMPWPEPFASDTKQHFRISISWPVVDHERLLVVTFMQNTSQSSRRDFRLVCSKKLPAAAILYRGERAGKRKDLYTASGCCFRSAYPEISEKEEKALGKWLGKAKTQNHYLPELEEWVRRAISEEIMRERDARGELRDADVSLCPEEIPPEMERFIRQTVLPADRVLIYKKGNTRGFCYSCGSHVRAKMERFKQNKMVRCPTCGEIVTCYLDTSDRFKVDYVNNIASIQKGTDGRTVFIRQWHLKRDPTGRWADVTGYLEEICRYAIRGDKVAKWQKENKYNFFMNTCRYDMSNWTRMYNPSVVYDGGYYFHTPFNWKEVFSGTALQYCDLMSYTTHQNDRRWEYNPIRFLMDWAQYPMVEKLWKAGYTKLVHERIGGLRKECRYTINWKKDSFRDALKFPTRLMRTYPQREWTMEKIAKTTELWEQVQLGKLMEEDVPDLIRSPADWGHIFNAMGHATVWQILRYIDRNVEEETAIKKQKEEEARKKNCVYWSNRPTDVPGTYRDYLNECVLLNLDLDDHQVLFPPNLQAAHSRTMGLVKYKMDEIKREKFAKACKSLEWMKWEDDDLLIRAPVDTEELIAEGAYLNHCVAGYADRMANGKTVILLIRRKEKPDTPFYTMEWLDGHVQQCRTSWNDCYTNNEKVHAFVENWIKKVINKRKKKAATSAA